MRHRSVRYCFVFSLFLFHSPMAWAYFDPGSGGYLISSILPAIGSFFAFVLAAATYFFRNFFVKEFQRSFLNHRPLFLGVILIISCFLGAAAASCILRPAPDKLPFEQFLTGAHVVDKTLVSPGYNLFDGKLMDNDGHIIRAWSDIDHADLGVLDTNGDYYAQKHRHRGWGRYTWDDRTVWKKKEYIHHEILLTPQNTVIVLGQEIHPYNGQWLSFDTIEEFNKDGILLRKYSIWDHLQEFQKFHQALESDMPDLAAFLLKKKITPPPHYLDKLNSYYHLNMVSLLPHNSLEGSYPMFHEGNWLISFRHGSMMFIIDRDTQKILWHAIDDQVPGRLEGQHSPLMLPNGHILVFDNGRYRGWSRLIEIDPLTLKILWEYKADGFYSKSAGFVQKLPNNDLLVTESNKGRVFELTLDKKIVWEYYDPRHVDPQDEDETNIDGRHEIYAMHRYPLEMIDPLLKR